MVNLTQLPVTLLDVPKTPLTVTLPDILATNDRHLFSGLGNIDSDEKKTD